MSFYNEIMYFMFHFSNLLFISFSTEILRWMGNEKIKKLSTSFYRLAAFWWLSILGINFQLKTTPNYKGWGDSKINNSFFNPFIPEIICVRVYLCICWDNAWNFRYMATINQLFLAKVLCVICLCLEFA